MPEATPDATIPAAAPPADTGTGAATVAATPAATVAPAVAATPAAPAAPAVDSSKPITLDAPVAAAPTPPADAVIEYAKTGDPGLDVALQYVGARGFGPEHPAVVAATKGDFAALEAALVALGDKAPGHKAYVELAKTAYTARSNAAAEAVKATNTAVYAAVGGEGKWAEVHAWAVANADEGEKRSLNAAFAAGGFAAVAAAEKLSAAYARTGTKPKSVVKDGTPAHTSADVGTLDGKAYGRAVAELSLKLGNRMVGSQEYAALQARRRAHRG